jgi:hypothetical protein
MEAQSQRAGDASIPPVRHRCTNAAMIIKVGTMDDPSVFKAQFAIFMCDKQHFHLIPEDLPTFDKRPG